MIQMDSAHSDIRRQNETPKHQVGKLANQLCEEQKTTNTVAVISYLWCILTAPWLEKSGSFANSCVMSKRPWDKKDKVLQENGQELSNTFGKVKVLECNYNALSQEKTYWDNKTRLWNRNSRRWRKGSMMEKWLWDKRRKLLKNKPRSSKTLAGL